MIYAVDTIFKIENKGKRLTFVATVQKIRSFDHHRYAGFRLFEDVSDIKVIKTDTLVTLILTKKSHFGWDYKSRIEPFYFFLLRKI